VAAGADAVLVPISNLEELAAARSLIASVDAAVGPAVVSFFAAVSEAFCSELPDDFPPPFEGFARIGDPQFHSHIRAWVHGIKKAAARTARAEARYEALFAHINDAAVLADADTGLILDVNRRALELWGKRREEMVGHSQASLHPSGESGREIFIEHRKMLEKQGFAPATEFPILHKDGRIIDVEISASRFMIGPHTRLLGLFRDCTERKASAAARRAHEAERARAERLEGLATLAAGVGHEVNNPLAYLIGNLEFLSGEFARNKLPDDLGDALKDAIDGAKRLRTVVRRLQDLDTRPWDPARARPAAPQPALSPAERTSVAATAHVAEALDDALESLRFRHAGLCTITVTPVPETLAVHLTPTRLTQVLVNLITNTLDAFVAARRDADSEGTGSENRIEVTVTADSAFATIAIADNGIGMTPEALRNAFDPTFTTKSTISGIGSKGRSGLGLGVSKKFVTMAGGTLTLSSTPRSDGSAPSGTTATVRLRRADNFS
jgi:PAS domain S-box-containing protein